MISEFSWLDFYFEKNYGIYRRKLRNKMNHNSGKRDQYYLKHEIDMILQKF